MFIVNEENNKFDRREVHRISKKNHTKQGKVREIIKDVTDLCVMYICGFDFDSISLFSRISQNKTTPFCFFFAFFYFTEKRSIS